MPPQDLNNVSRKESDIDLRSEEVQEILAAPPGRMLRWSTTIILCILLLILFFAWFIKYPDVITGQAKITTVNPPVQQISYTSGKIIALYRKDNEKVKKDEIIAIIENPLPKEQEQDLKIYIVSVATTLLNPNAVLPVTDSTIVLGELQPSFNKLASLIKVYNKTITDSFYRKNIRTLNAQLSQYQNLTGLSKSQVNLSKQELDNALAKYKASKQLYETKYISKNEFLAEEGEYISVQKRVSDLEKVKVQNSISIIDYEKQLNELQSQYKDKLFQTAYSINEEINSIKNQLEQWERQYVIKAPFNGTLSYLNSWSLNKYVKQGDGLFMVVPDDQQYICEAYIPSANFGKIAIGQTANLRIDNYAYNEWGELTGKVKLITLAPGTDNNYRVEIVLNHGLTSTHNKQFEYKPEMTATAQIITEELSLFERVFYKLRKLFAR